MIYTPMTNTAMRIAYQAHHGQMDYNGIPYIFHPVHLAEQMDDEFSCCVALLHDVVEDTAVTLEELKAIFPREVTDAVVRTILIMFGQSKKIRLHGKSSWRILPTIRTKPAVSARTCQRHGRPNGRLNMKRPQKSSLKFDRID